MLNPTERIREAAIDGLFSLEGVMSISTYADEGVLTSDEGIVVKMTNGEQFQVTIVQSVSA